MQIDELQKKQLKIDSLNRIKSDQELLIKNLNKVILAQEQLIQNLETENHKIKQDSIDTYSYYHKQTNINKQLADENRFLKRKIKAMSILNIKLPKIKTKEGFFSKLSFF